MRNIWILVSTIGAVLLTSVAEKVVMVSGVKLAQVWNNFVERMLAD